MAARIDWTRFSGDPRVRSSTRIRASDADRDAALAVLAEAYADGRLDLDEHDRRTSLVLAAVVLGDLRPLLADLEPALPAKSAHDRAVDRYRRDLADRRHGVVFVGAVTTMIWGMTSLVAGDLLFFWPAIPTGVLAVGWLLQTAGREDRIARLRHRYERRDARRLMWRRATGG